MKRVLLILSIAISIFLSNCINSIKNNSFQVESYITDFKYERHEAVGPEGLICFLKIQDSLLRNILLQPNNKLYFNYEGGIYNIDSLYFPPPLIFEYDSLIVLGQGVYGLRQYSDHFIDSLILRTKREISIEINDTLNNKIWTLITPV